MKQQKKEIREIEKELIEQSQRIVFGKRVRRAVNPRRNYADN